MTSTKSTLLLWFGLALALGASLYSLSFRYRVESRNRAVELLVEMDVVEDLAAAQGLTLGDGLKLLKNRGVGAVAISEDTIGKLVDAGKVRIGPVAFGDKAVALQSGPADLVRVNLALSRRSPRLLTETRLPGILEVPDLSAELLRSVAIGLDPEVSKLASKLGFRIYARVVNPIGANSEMVRGAIDDLKKQGADVVLPQGDQVLGRREQLDALTEGVQSTGLLYASPEFTKLGGDLNAISAMPDRVVRLHSALAAELDKMTLGEAVERYARAGRERNIRALLLRPLTFAAEKPLDAFGDLAEAIGKRLVKEGAAIGPAKPFEAPGVPRWVFPIIGLGAALAALYAFSNLISNRAAVIALGLLAAIVGLGAYSEGVRTYAALMAALAFPIAAFAFLESSSRTGIALNYLIVTFISVIGGFAAAGTLNDLPFYIRADQFEGVKAAHFLPVFVVGAFFTLRLVSWRDGLNSPITWLQALLALFVLAALGFMFLRTGNDNPAGVSGLEMKIRSLLDNFLPVRPRTKEFMFGYPALVVGLGLLARVRSGAPGTKPLAGWSVLALMVGAIGPTSAVNTMCHLHTPLEVSLVRILVGLVLGGIIGAAVWFVVRWRLPEPRDLA